MILTSLQDNGHVAVLLGFARPTEPVTSCAGGGTDNTLQSSSIQLAEMLMKTLLMNLAFHAVTTLGSLSFSLMVVSHSQETFSRNLYEKHIQVDLCKKLDRLTWFLVQDFSCTSILHRIQHSSIPYKKLACT